LQGKGKRKKKKGPDKSHYQQEKSEAIDSCGTLFSPGTGLRRSFDRKKEIIQPFEECFPPGGRPFLGNEIEEVECSCQQCSDFPGNGYARTHEKTGEVDKTHEGGGFLDSQQECPPGDPEPGYGKKKGPVRAKEVHHYHREKNSKGKHNPYPFVLEKYQYDEEKTHQQFGE
jgi:hypothetical protein